MKEKALKLQNLLIAILIFALVSIFVIEGIKTNAEYKKVSDSTIQENSDKNKVDKEKEETKKETEKKKDAEKKKRLKRKKMILIKHLLLLQRKLIKLINKNL